MPKPRENNDLVVQIRKLGWLVATVILDGGETRCRVMSDIVAILSSDEVFDLVGGVV